jgi:hypothetical protein
MINVSDLTKSDFLAANDYEVGQVWPPLEILKVEMKKSPNGTVEKASITLSKAPKPWMCSSNVTLREIGAAIGMKDVEKAWPGNSIQIKIVGNIRRPDGTVGNAFRVAKIINKAKGEKQ